MAAACALDNTAQSDSTVQTKSDTDDILVGELGSEGTEIQSSEGDNEVQCEKEVQTVLFVENVPGKPETSNIELTSVSSQCIATDQTNNKDASLSQNMTTLLSSVTKESGNEDKDGKLLFEVAVQANDYDIERRSGKIPARRRVIPFKFRDYRNPDLVNENEKNSDSDYEPDDLDESKIRRKRKQTFIKSQRGRPKKHPKIEENIISVVVKGQTNGSVGVPNTLADTENLKNSSEDVLGDGNDVIPSETQNKLDIGTMKLVQIDGQSVSNGQQDQAVKTDNEKNVVVAKTTEDLIDKTVYGFQCSVCSKMFSTKGNLKTHLRTHTDDKPFPCDIKGCGKSFRSNETLRRHRLSHMGIKQYDCTYCDKKFSSNVSLQEHMSRHTDSKPYQCHICLRNFRQISCLRRHLVTHSSETPYSCQICSRKFTQLVYLRSHMKVHTGERPFKCHIESCGKAFAHQSDLNRHKIVHSGLKPYVCDVCGTRFSDPSSRRRHEREHVGVKPYPCQLCGESFKRAGQLKAHLGRKHSNEQEGVQVVRSSSGALLFLFKDTDKEMPTLFQDQNVNKQSLAKQKKIVKLIEDLNSSMVQHVQINLPPQHNYSASSKPVVKGTDDTSEVIEGEALYLETPDVEQQQQALEETIQAEIIQNLPASESEMSNQAMPELVSDYQNVEVQQEQNTDGATVITIAEVDEQGQASTGQVPVEYLQIIEELAPDSLEQQIVEVHYQQSEDIQEQPVNQEAPEKLVKQDEQPSSSSSSWDFVSSPDFNCQEYYNWLSSFTELCKVVPMPLDLSLFQKISQVHKTLSDVMATPTGVVADKENFKILMNISKDLNTIINEHLCFVMQNLDHDIVEVTS